jgi:acyl transferase domain-containing protein
VAFLFPGGGAQYVNMAAEIYRCEPVFREQFDLCARRLRAPLGVDLREIIYVAAEQEEAAAFDLAKTSLGLPALFATEYALAQLWMSWGVRPQALIGHSLGEYTAACVAGVFSLEDALALVALRGRLFEKIPEGKMLNVSLSEAELKPYLNGEEFSIAAINHPQACVVSGAAESIERLALALAEKQIETHQIHISVAAHSRLVEPIMEDFRGFVSSLNLHAPQLPFLSNVSGTWITSQQATDPEYWVQHLRRTVRFAEGVQELFRNRKLVLLEVGPGNTLAALAQRHPQKPAEQVVLSSVKHPHDTQPDEAVLLHTLGRLWIAGVKIDWDSFYHGQQRRRLPLPATPFERKRYWIDAPLETTQTATVADKRPDLADWFYVPSWKRSAVRPTAAARQTNWLVFVDRTGVGEELVSRLRANAQHVVAVQTGDRFEQTGEGAYRLRPSNPDDYTRLLSELDDAHQRPESILHLWSVTADADEGGTREIESSNELGFYSLLALAQALKGAGSEQSARITLITNNVYDVTGEESLQPEKAIILGPVKVISQEYPEISCNQIDILLPEDAKAGSLMRHLEAELALTRPEMFVALRGAYRWLLTYEPLPLEPGEATFRERGVYLITGGAGGVGRLLARYLAHTARARLALVCRSASVADAALTSEIEALGGEVLLLEADVANELEMQHALEQTLERFGELHGVIHAAGVTTGESLFRPFEEIGYRESEIQFRPKVYGLRVLEKVLEGRALDFVLLISSNASVLGGLGLVAYSAANHFMDAFAIKQSRSGGTRWISANWDGWPTERVLKAGGAQTSIARFAMTLEESQQAFERVVASGAGQVVVSAGDIHARLERWTHLNQEAMPPPLSHAAQPSSAEPSSNGTVAPRNEVEQRLLDLWGELLGGERIGVFDNFFDLKGDSLLGSRLITRINRMFRVQLKMKTLFEQPTIAGLSECVASFQQQLLELQQKPETTFGTEEEEAVI